MLDYYEILQVSPKAEQEVIEGAYKRLAMKYHPDLNKTPDAPARMKQINEAYEVLRDPVQRAQYDRIRNTNTPPKSEPKREPPKESKPPPRSEPKPPPTTEHKSESPPRNEPKHASPNPKPTPKPAWFTYRQVLQLVTITLAVLVLIVLVATILLLAIRG